MKDTIHFFLTRDFISFVLENFLNLYVEKIFRLFPKVVLPQYLIVCIATSAFVRIP